MGDQFSLKPQSCVRTTVVNPPYSKLAYKFFGPFTIMQHVGTFTYQLALLDDSRAHPVFHVSQLKPFMPDYYPAFM